MRAQDFDWGHGTESPLKESLLRDDDRARHLVDAMREQRMSIAIWQAQPENFAIMKNEKQLLNHDADAIDFAKALQYVEDRAWSKDADIKARQVLCNKDIVSVIVHKDETGREYFLDCISIFRSLGDQVQEWCSFTDEIELRLQAQRVGPVEKTVSMIEFEGNCHFNALLQLGTEGDCRGHATADSPPDGYGAASPGKVTHATADSPPDGYGAASPGEVTHAFTLRGAQLSHAILASLKRIENRHFRLAPGWYALHSGLNSEAQPKARAQLDKVKWLLPEENTLPHGKIVGAVKISHSLTLGECESDPWAIGPVCNVIEAVCVMTKPVMHRGALSIWKIGTNVLAEVQKQLSTAPVKTNDISDLLPPRLQDKDSSSSIMNLSALKLMEQPAASADASLAEATEATEQVEVVASAEAAELSALKLMEQPAASADASLAEATEATEQVEVVASAEAAEAAEAVASMEVVTAESAGAAMSAPLPLPPVLASPSLKAHVLQAVGKPPRKCPAPSGRRDFPLDKCLVWNEVKTQVRQR